MDPKGHLIDQKGLKMYEKRWKMEFSDLIYLLFSGFFLSGIGGYSLPPLTENHPAQKPLAEMGVPPPLNGKNPLSIFWQVPLKSSKYPWCESLRFVCCWSSVKLLLGEEGSLFIRKFPLQADLAATWRIIKLSSISKS